MSSYLGRYKDNGKEMETTSQAAGLGGVPLTEQHNPIILVSIFFSMIPI